MATTGVLWAAAGENLTPLPRPMVARMASLGLAVGRLPLKGSQQMLMDDTRQKTIKGERRLSDRKLPSDGNVNPHHIIFVDDNSRRLLLLLLRLLGQVGGGFALLGLLWLVLVRHQVILRQLGNCG